MDEIIQLLRYEEVRNVSPYYDLGSAYEYHSLSYIQEMTILMLSYPISRRGAIGSSMMNNNTLRLRKRKVVNAKCMYSRALLMHKLN